MSKKQAVISGKAAGQEAALAQEKKKKFIMFGSIGGAILIVAIVAIILFFFGPKDSGFDAAESIYSSNKISYSREDYERDRVAIDNGTTDTSDAYTKMKKKNNKVINNILKHYGEDPEDPSKPTPVTPEGDDVDMDAWCKALIKQLTESNNYINSHYGLENVSFVSTMGEQTFDAREFAYKDIANVEAYMAGSSPQDMYYWAMTPQQMEAGLRGSAYTLEQFSTEIAMTWADKNLNIYKSWFRLKHPVFSKIYTVALSENEVKVDDETISYLTGEITTDNGSYIVYSNLVINQDRTYSFEFYDVKGR